MPFSLIARLVALALLAAVIAGAAWKLRHGGVVAGRAEVQAQWDADKAQRMAAALAASEAARAKEAALRAQRDKVEADYAKARKNAASAAASAGAELERLRDQIARGAASAPRGGASAAAVGVDGTRAGDLLGACAGALSEMARDADRIAGKLTALQGYVAGSCR